MKTNPKYEEGDSNVRMSNRARYKFKLAALKQGITLKAFLDNLAKTV